MSMAAKNINVVMLSATHDAALGDVVKVEAETAERLIAGGHARAPREGEVKAAAEGK
jgi:hypothetical protein